MKFDGKMLLDAGLSAGPIIGKLLAILNQDSYTVNGMNQIVQGFLNHKLPKHVETSRGDVVPNLNLMKLFYDFEEEHKVETFQLLKASLPYNVFGAENIEKGAIDQMNNAMRMPVSVAGALSADAHQGYALPIGGIWATDGVICPQAVGVDISCRVRLSVFPNEFPSRNSLFKEEIRKAIKTQTVFGTGIEKKDGLLNVGNEEVLDNDLWSSIPFLKKYKLRDLATKQLGTSGAGNHYLDAGEYSVSGKLPVMAIMSHSGSRGVGYKVAKFYHDIAVKRFNNKKFHGLAWLDMDSDAGREYFSVMQLCGLFAQANHQIIHDRICKFLKLSPVEVYETNHNFCWEEKHIINGAEREVMVHRKGAVRAFSGELGIICGSMGTPSFIVSGKSNEDSLCSCSHGSGRTMSRTAAKNAFTQKQMTDFMSNANIELLAGELDECPMAYKDVIGVMDSQKELVDIVGRFDPKMVMMSSEPEARW